MALNANTLKSEIKSAVDAVADSYKNGEKSNDDILQAWCEAIITHITTNAEVIITSGSSAGTYQVK